MPDVRLLSSPAGLPLSLAVNDEVSRFACMQYLSVPGVYDYAEPAADSRLCARHSMAFSTFVGSCHSASAIAGGVD
jgi:hypothetical protein